MCLAVPARIKEIRQGQVALVEMNGITLEARIDLVPEARVGDYLVIHAGFAISSMDEEEAMETLRLLDEALDEGGRENEK